MHFKNLTAEELKEAISFSYDHDTYKRDNRARESLNKLLGTKFIAVFRKKKDYDSQWAAPKIDWSGETVYILTEKMKLVRMSNSEWAFFSEQEIKK